MLPSSSDLTFFMEVCRTENMSRAAERLGITQPALSQAVKRLEHSFGQQLLVRSKSGVQLTKAGEKLSFKARELLDSWQKLKEEALRDQEELRGHYKIGFHSSVAIYTAPHFLPSLLAKYPALEIGLEHDLSRKITEQVVSMKLDFGITVNPFPHPDLVIREMFKDEVIFCRSKKKTPNNDLEGSNSVLILEPNLNQSQELMKKIMGKKELLTRKLTSSNLEVIKSLVLSGSGIGIIPSRVLGDDYKKIENLSDSQYKWPKFTDRICLVYRHDIIKNSAGKQLGEHIKSSLMKH